MLKQLIKNPESVLKKCIDDTFDYLISNPADYATKSKAKKNVTRKQVESDIEGFFCKSPRLSPRTTVPDELVSDMLELIGGVEPHRRQQVQDQYNIQKQIEMKIGDFLEMYLLEHSFAFGWVQTGNLIRGTDMIKKKTDGTWLKLQIKNSDNTINSSSAGFVVGKAKTWARRNSTQGTHYWHEFPDPQVRSLLSENAFRKFIKRYYTDILK